MIAIAWSTIVWCVCWRQYEFIPLQYLMSSSFTMRPLLVLLAILFLTESVAGRHGRVCYICDSSGRSGPKLVDCSRPKMITCNLSDTSCGWARYDTWLVAGLNVNQCWYWHRLLGCYAPSNVEQHTYTGCHNTSNGDRICNCNSKVRLSEHNSHQRSHIAVMQFSWPGSWSQ